MVNDDKCSDDEDEKKPKYEIDVSGKHENGRRQIHEEDELEV